MLNPGPTLVTVKWQGQNVHVRTQDLRRSLVYLSSLHGCFLAEDRDDPWELLVAFAESLPGTHLRIGWFQVPSGNSDGQAAENHSRGNHSRGQPLRAVQCSEPRTMEEDKGFR